MTLLDSRLELKRLRRSVWIAAGLTALLGTGCTDRTFGPDDLGDDGGDSVGDDGAEDDGEDDGTPTTGGTDGGSADDDGGDADVGDDGSGDDGPPPVPPPVATCTEDPQVYGDVVVCLPDDGNCGFCGDACIAQGSATLDAAGEWACGGWEFESVSCNEVIGDQCCQTVHLYDIGCAGRPFEVAGEHRVAESVARPDWSADLVPSRLAELGLAQRRLLASYWRDVGLAEHASVASFARFSIDLMTMGATPTLLSRAHRAATDEVEHARLAFGLASAYAGTPVGPGMFDPGAQAPRDEIDIVTSAIVEGCIEETLSAALASIAAAQTEDVVVAAVLRKIARDEERHAALAWSFVRWVADARPDLHGVIDAAFEMGITRASRPDAKLTAANLSAHGLLDPATRRATIRATLREVVQTAHRGLLADVA